MSEASQLIQALGASYVKWEAYQELLTARFASPPMIFMVQTDGRTFIISDGHNGAWRWWPWTRRRVARAARSRYAQEMAARPASGESVGRVYEHDVRASGPKREE